MLNLIKVQHGKRTEVRPSEDWNVLAPVLQEALRRENLLRPVWNDLYAFRLLVEPAAAAWMAKRGTVDELERLVELALSMSSMAEDLANLRRVLAADQLFHRLIAQGARNRVLASISQSFWEAVSVLWLESRLDADQLRDVAVQHQQIVNAIVARDSEAAEAAMRSHLEQAAELDAIQFGAV
jgi:DNA-binding FadR family transcriptional regulator